MKSGGMAWLLKARLTRKEYKSCGDTWWQLFCSDERPEEGAQYHGTRATGTMSCLAQVLGTKLKTCSRASFVLSGWISPALRLVLLNKRIHLSKVNPSFYVICPSGLHDHQGNKKPAITNFLTFQFLSKSQIVILYSHLGVQTDSSSFWKAWRCKPILHLGGSC